MSEKLTSMLSKLDTNLAPPTDRSGDSQLSSTSSDAPKIFPMYICINEYFKRMEDELDMRPGDKIQVLTDDEEYNDGWYFGRNLRTKEEGLYPVVFTQVISTERKPTLMRAKSSKRVYSPLGMEAGNLSSYSVDAPSSELPTPQPLETAASISFEGKNPLERIISVKNTMHDIDKALEEFKFESNESIGHKEGYTSDDAAHDTNLSSTTGLDVTANNRSDVTINSSSKMSAGDLNPVYVEDWSPEQVTTYFLNCGFDSHSASKFRLHKISGKILLELELSHLKELDVTSFGTRFEMFKEIESLKELAVSTTGIQNRSSVLMPPAHLNEPSYKQHARKKSQSMDDLPLQKPSETERIIRQRPTSLLINGKAARKFGDQQLESPLEKSEINYDMFASPRQAPKPPAYPSPVQPPKSPMFGGSERFSSAIKNLTPDSDSDSDDTSFKNLAPNRKSFNDKANNRDSILHSGHTNSAENASYHTANDSDNDAEQDRPTSSIYASSSIQESTDHYASNNLEVAEGKEPKRSSSMLSYFSKTNDKTSTDQKVTTTNSVSKKKKSSFITSPFRREFTENAVRSTPKTAKHDGTSTTPRHLKNKKKSDKQDNSKRRSVSAKDPQQVDLAKKILEEDKSKRSVSEAVKDKTLRAMTTRQPLRKQQTSAFMEGIRHISVKDAMKTADYSGWMSKKGGNPMSSWKTRFFTLHGTRLSYFANTTDTRERGLIDITAHRVVPAKEDDKLVSLYAASTGKGRYCFKLIPPQPGSRKGLTFTQPRVHYFAVDTKDEMRGWMATLIKTTIDIDTTVPVISSYTTPTVSLSRAKEMLVEAREENKKREEQRLLEAHDEDMFLWDEGQKKKKTATDREHSEDDHQSSTGQSSLVEGTSNVNTTLTTSSTTGSNGFSSPYLLASGILSPGVARHNSSRVGEKSKKLGKDDHLGPDLKYTGEKI
ncbi:hypothetical protein KAFR_0K01960 [Kazachstania africana CBS 2517]|uniref:Protein BOI2 n=1 Tax=Kazachstania africana (strain ATCC 22294 / BCRC 22015 / CBS 2517 / CECT 1963 / NBRC 1671 / NRRL Y-8276) TaxID=1071382 RepID=H2B1Q0_KAZAF|nr:hypothetical protein KAFR_0K01960 [Kazachstania africana CBS 2517]CCF60550.1 hypothetical protein KAFR_0K01960 [Kazachstania africana CBS 2517]